jgi:acyl-CoA reductase-like NAD-dependent aldehyde dehydrogenase
VLKVSSETPVTTSEYARICYEAGIPSGVLNVVHGDGLTTGAALAAHPDVPKLTFTGSTEAGRTIMRAAEDQVKSCHLELGGKTANIVFADCDFEKAISGSLMTSFSNSGQICTAGTRLLIDQRLAGDFLEEFVARAKRLRVGDPLKEDTQMGPVVSARQLARVTSYIEKGITAGAQLLLGEERPSVPGCEGGYFVGPTIFDAVTPTMAIAQEEIFGPVLSVLSFQSDDEAVAIANGVSYGLAATIWTNRLDRALSMAPRLQAGIVWTNCPHHLQWNVPYEGHKQSGLGEDMGSEAISEFTELKVNYVNFGGKESVW